MHYYKQNWDDGTYQTFDDHVNCDDLLEISETEYNAGVAALLAQAEEEDAAAEQTKDAQIAQLEQENAALLYQLLTGEEYTDV